MTTNWTCWKWTPGGIQHRLGHKTLFFPLPFFRHDLFHQFSPPCHFSVCSRRPGLHAIVTLSTLSCHCILPDDERPRQGQWVTDFVCSPSLHRAWQQMGVNKSLLKEEIHRWWEWLVPKWRRHLSGFAMWIPHLYPHFLLPASHFFLPFPGFP